MKEHDNKTNIKLKLKSDNLQKNVLEYSHLITYSFEIFK